MVNSVNYNLIRVIVFLVVIVIIIAYLYPFLTTAFFSNIYINSTIIITLIFGLFVLQMFCELNTTLDKT